MYLMFSTSLELATKYAHTNEVNTQWMFFLVLPVASLGAILYCDCDCCLHT